MCYVTENKADVYCTQKFVKYRKLQSDRLPSTQFPVVKVHVYTSPPGNKVVFKGTMIEVSVEKSVELESLQFIMCIRDGHLRL